MDFPATVPLFPLGFVLLANKPHKVVISVLDITAATPDVANESDAIMMAEILSA